MRLFQFRPLSGDAAGADSSRCILKYSFESVFNETPATPTMTQVRFVRSSLNHRNRTGVSSEIRTDRMRSDLQIMSYGVDGGFEAELHSATFSTHLGGFEELVEAAMCGTWTANVLKNSTVSRSILVEQGYSDISRFINYRGCVVNQMNLTIPSNDYVMLGFDLMGTQGFVNNATVAGSTLQQNTLSPITGGPFITGISMTPSDLTGTKIRNLRINLNNNLRERMSVDSYITQDFGRGSCDITGSFEIYFQNSLLYADFLANSFLDLSFNIVDVGAVGTGSTWALRMPKMKLSSGSVDVGGIDQDVFFAVDFRALYDSTNNCELMITRSAS